MMILTGQQKRALREGILGAYPAEDELKMLLSDNMNLNWSAIARGEDYTIRVNYLVEQLQADFLEECVLLDMQTPLVLGLDEFDIVLSKGHLLNDFCGLLRSWNDFSRTGDANSEQWEKLRLVISHSTEIYADLDINQSPVSNVGMEQQLLDFNEEQIQKLALLYALDWNRLKELKSLVGGHPYLLRKAFYHLRHKDCNLPQILETASTMSGIYSDHFRRHLLILQRHPDLARTLYRIATKNNPVEVDCVEAFQLNSMGLISLTNNTATLRFELYRQYFKDNLQSG
jgi:serine/threonine-protein kinase